MLDDTECAATDHDVHYKQEMLHVTSTKGPGKRGHKIADTLYVCCRHKCFPVCPHAQHLLWTQNVSGKNQKHFLCLGHKFCVRNKCCARAQTVSATMCPLQCVLVCQGLQGKMSRSQRKQRGMDSELSLSQTVAFRQRQPSSAHVQNRKGETLNGESDTIVYQE